MPRTQAIFSKLELLRTKKGEHLIIWEAEGVSLQGGPSEEVVQVTFSLLVDTAQI